MLKHIIGIIMFGHDLQIPELNWTWPASCFSLEARQNTAMACSYDMRLKTLLGLAWLGPHKTCLMITDALHSAWRQKAGLDKALAHGREVWARWSLRSFPIQTMIWYDMIWYDMIWYDMKNLQHSSLGKEMLAAGSSLNLKPAVFSQNHRIPEWLKLEGTSGSLLISPLWSSKAT